MRTCKFARSFPWIWMRLLSPLLLLFKFAGAAKPRSVLGSPSFQVSLVNVTKAPIVSSQNQAGEGRCSAATLCYNAALVDKGPNSPAGLLLRLRNMSSPNETRFLGPSKLGWAPFEAGSATKLSDCTVSNIVRASNTAGGQRDRRSSRCP